jgi:hypothetical protein
MALVKATASFGNTHQERPSQSKFLLQAEYKKAANSGLRHQLIDQFLE